ncbi:MAG TPA: CDP-alcohol phosphatidyltransferase family protein [Thermoplasmata archaeon]|nr:CDP-alcohol phosphatidyltransferase family protein [Thermoplasmata archaeon]
MSPRGWRAGANLATLANALLGAGAVGYALTGNPRFALLLITGAIGFDGLDGLLSRRAGGEPRVLGRVLDSVADAVSFAIAPAILVAYPTFDFGAWQPYTLLARLVGVELGALALARLVYFTWRGHASPHFVGASTPQNLLAVAIVLLFFDVPAFAGERPLLALAMIALLAPLMVLPVPYPKMRRGTALRPAMTLTSLALAAALLPQQWWPPPGSFWYSFSEVAAGLAAVGIATYYVLGPRSVRLEELARPEGASHA